jgi:hypothetical protein
MKSRKLGRLAIRAFQIVLIALALFLVVLYGWAFVTLRTDDLKADSEFPIRSRKAVLLEGSRRPTEGFPRMKQQEEVLDHDEAPPPPIHGEKRTMTFPFTDPKYRIYSLPNHDTSERCRATTICDGNHSCGIDNLGCVTSSKERQARIREAARWSWMGYK